MSQSWVRTEFDQPGARLHCRHILSPIFRLIPFLNRFKGLFAVALITMILFAYLGTAIVSTGVFMWLNNWYSHLLSYRHRPFVNQHLRRHRGVPNLAPVENPTGRLRLLRGES